jgi:hypothetical protein
MLSYTIGLTKYNMIMPIIDQKILTAKHHQLYLQLDKLKKENEELKEKLINLIINKNIISVDEFELLFKYCENNKPKIYPPLPPSRRSSFSDS